MSRSTTTIGVNLLWLVPGVVGGSEEYTIRLLRSVGPLLAEDIRLRIYCRSDLLDAYPDLADMHAVRTMSDLRSKAIRIGAENSWLAAESRADAVVHHAGGTVPFVRSVPGAVTIHDPQPLDHPENFHPGKRFWLGRTVPYSVRVARLVLCPSEFTARRLQELLNVPEDKLRVVVHGHRIEHGRGGAGTGISNRVIGGSGSVADGADPVVRPADPDTDMPGRLGRYLLYPAIAYQHKRHIDLIRMLDRLGSECSDLALVLTGRPGPELGSVVAEAARLGLTDRLHVLGRVSAPELERLYRSAEALVFPSAYEGFGNPALEAMSLGCPAVVSAAGALPEVVGDGGLVFPVGDIDAMTTAVTKVLCDPGLAADLRNRGLARARSFDTDVAARQLADVYSELSDTRQV